MLFNKKFLSVAASFGMKPLHADSQLEVRHDSGTLVLLAGKHVDDIKITGSTPIIKALLEYLEQAFGKLKVQWHSFDNCGLRYVQDPSTFAIEVSQHHYALTLKPIASPSTLAKTSASSGEVEETVRAMFISLLGAVAYLLLTRTDVAVYVSALQRVSSKPTSLHVRRLNALLKWIQQNPTSLRYSSFTRAPSLLAVSDSAFKAEEDKGLAMRGVLLGLSECSTGQLHTANFALLESVSKRQRHVCRSTWSAELFAATDAVDTLLLLSSALHEIRHGSQPVATLRQLSETGTFDVVTILAVDAHGLYLSVKGQHSKIPTEK